MAPRPPKDWDDEDFSDIWNTNRGRGKIDKSRIWGTEEYYVKHGGSEDDAWDSGLKDSLIRQRIQLDKDRIRADAARIKKQAEDMARSLKRDLKKTININLSKSYKGLTEGNARGGRGSIRTYEPRITKPTRPSTQKPKKRKKLSMSKSGIGIGTIIFWGVILYGFFGGDDDIDTTSKAVDTSTTTEITEQVKDTFNNLKPEAEALINKAKAELNKVTAKKDKPEPINSVPDNNDPYSQDNDRYGSIDDKW